MAIGILTDEKEGKSCLYCTTTMWAFGGIFQGEENPQDFLDWMDENEFDDARKYTDKELIDIIHNWRKTLKNE